MNSQWQLELRCTRPNGSAYVGLKFSDAHGNRINAAFSLRIAGAIETIVEYPLRFFGYDVLKFRIELSKCYSDLSGSASLQDCDGTVALCLTVFDNRGGIVLGGQLADHSRGGDVVSADNFLKSDVSPSGVLVFFDGFQVDQSYIPKILGDLDSFLRESNVDVTNPYPPSMFIGDA